PHTYIITPSTVGGYVLHTKYDQHIQGLRGSLKVYLGEVLNIKGTITYPIKESDPRNIDVIEDKVIIQYTPTQKLVEEDIEGMVCDWQWAAARIWAAASSNSDTLIHRDDWTAQLDQLVDLPAPLLARNSMN